MFTELKEDLTISDAITDSFENIGECVERFISAIPSSFELAQQIFVECESHSFIYFLWIFTDDREVLVNRR